MKSIVLLLIVTISLYSCNSSRTDEKQLGQQISQLQQENETLKQERQQEQEQKRQKQVQEEERQQKRQEREQLINELNRVTLEVANQNVGALGGINNIQIRVQNPTKIKFNYLKASVGYYKANGEFYKNETVTFYNVEPYSSQVEAAPSSDRGTSLTTSVISYKSPALPTSLQADNG